MMEYNLYTFNQFYKIFIREFMVMHCHSSLKFFKFGIFPTLFKALKYFLDHRQYVHYTYMV